MKTFNAQKVKSSYILLLACSALSLTACSNMATREQVASQKNTEELIQQNLADTSAKISQMQYGIFRGPVGFNTAPTTVSTAITSDAQFVSFDWEGDAITLLAKLARARGQTFAYRGVRLPLPISMHEVNTPYWSTLDHIQAQIGYRGLLVVVNNANTVELQFNAPNVTATDQRVAVIWKGASHTTTPTLSNATYPATLTTPSTITAPATSPVAVAPTVQPSTGSPLTTKPASGCEPGTGAVQLIWN